jgi:hypothetical protein
MNADRSGTVQEAEDGKALARGLTGLALVVLAVGFAIDRLADLEAGYMVTRILALPLLLAAVVMALRRGARTSAILPAILFVVLAIYLGSLAF